MSCFAYFQSAFMNLVTLVMISSSNRAFSSLHMKITKCQSLTKQTMAKNNPPFVNSINIKVVIYKYTLVRLKNI